MVNTWKSPCICIQLNYIEMKTIYLLPTRVLSTWQYAPLKLKLIVKKKMRNLNLFWISWNADVGLVILAALSLHLWHSQTQRNENHANSNLSVCHQVRVSQPWRAEDMCCCFRCESQNRVWLCLVVFVCVCVWFVGGQSGPSCLEHTWCVKAKRDQSNSESSLNHVTNLPVENKRFLLVKIISTAQLESYNRLDVISFGEHITMLNY